MSAILKLTAELQNRGHFQNLSNGFLIFKKPY